MTIIAVRIALGLSALAFTVGTAASGTNATGSAQPGACTATMAQSVNYHAGPNARHANTTQVRYAAAHAMPPARFAAASGKKASCSLAMNTKKSSTVLD